MRLFILRDASLARVFGIAQLQWHKVFQRLVRNNHPRGMHTCGAHCPFQLQRLVDDLLRNLVFLIQVVQLFDTIERTLQCNFRTSRNKARDAISYSLLAHDTRHVLDRCFCRHCVKGHHLRHTVLAILPCHVLDHFFTPIIRKVHVNIGHVRALCIEEALKRELVANGIDVSDPQGVGHQAAGSRTACRTTDAV